MYSSVSGMEMVFTLPTALNTWVPRGSSTLSSPGISVMAW